jgi:hypothetical protein
VVGTPDNEPNYEGGSRMSAASAVDRGEVKAFPVNERDAAVAWAAGTSQ